MKSSKSLFCLVPAIVLITAFHSLDAGERWDPERLAGFPEPPPPLKLVEAYPSLEIPKLIALNRVPGTDWLLAVDHKNDWGGPGRVYQFQESSEPKFAELAMFLERPEIIYGFAFDPKFESNRFVYVGCNGRSETLDEVATKVIRLRVDGDGPFVCDPESAVVVIEWKSNGHNGGDLAFGNDGMLYVSTGDGTSDSDVDRNGQNLSTLNGGIIRIDVDGVAGDQQYRIPPDNPFLDVPGARGELWAYGLRNPWRLSYDGPSGQLWTGNNGQDLWESVYLIEKGANYGWSIVESNHPFHVNQDSGPTPISKATVEHHHSEARSLTGGHVYRGSRFPWLVGAYVYGDYSTGNVWGVRHDSESVVWTQHLARSTAQISGFAVDSGGELLVADHAGKIFRFEVNNVAHDIEFPKLLSQTGLFEDLESEEMLDGVHEYYVNSPLWSDGAIKRRWLAVPEGETIGFKEQGAWEFPNDTVLVKSFSFQDKKGRSRRVETRLMTRRGGEWYGYSYRWNETQDDAELIEAGGNDEVLDWVVDSGEELTVRWQYPSRSECMVCHSRAAGFVLGLSTEQLNRSMACAENVGAEDVGAGEGVSQIGSLHSKGLLRDVPAEQDFTELARLADPYDSTADLEPRVRSYFHVNCATCHINAGGGNSKIVLDAFTEPGEMMLLDQPPLHTSLEIKGASLIAPEEPARSVLLARMARRGPSQMPPLATGRVDKRAVKLVEDWIESLGKK